MMKLKCVVVVLALVAIPRVKLDEGTFQGRGTHYTDKVLDPKGARGYACTFPDVPNGTKFYVALNKPQYGNSTNCGRYVRITCHPNNNDPSYTACKGRPTIAEILDECPECKNGDLDMSYQTFLSVFGVDGGQGHIEWSYVDACQAGPLQTIKLAYVDGSSVYYGAFNLLYAAKPVASVTCDGKPAQLTDNDRWICPGQVNSKTQLSIVSQDGERLPTDIELGDIEAGQLMDTKTQFASVKQCNGGSSGDTNPPAGSYSPPSGPPSGSGSPGMPPPQDHPTNSTNPPAGSHSPPSGPPSGSGSPGMPPPQDHPTNPPAGSHSPPSGPPGSSGSPGMLPPPQDHPTNSTNPPAGSHSPPSGPPGGSGSPGMLPPPEKKGHTNYGYSSLPDGNGDKQPSSNGSGDKSGREKKHHNLLYHHGHSNDAQRR